MKKSANQWFTQYLPLEYAELAISRIDKDYEDYEYEYTNPNIALTSSFEWSETPEGSKFWDSVCDSLPKVVDLPLIPNIEDTISNRYGHLSAKDLGDFICGDRDSLPTKEEKISSTKKSGAYLRQRRQLWINVYANVLNKYEKTYLAFSEANDSVRDFDKMFSED